MSLEANVYIVDGDQDTAKSIENLLSQHGYKLLSFDSADSFLQLAQLDEPGCLITDVQLPSIDGVELQKRLLAAESLLSLVVVTAVADVPLAVKMMERGAIKVLEKPYDQIELLDAVARGVAASRKRTQEVRLRASVQQRVDSLTPEEKQVLIFMLSDIPNKTIASGIRKGLRTVDRRRQAVLDKMQVRSVPELATLLASVGIEIQ